MLHLLSYEGFLPPRAASTSRVAGKKCPETPILTHSARLPALARLFPLRFGWVAINFRNPRRQQVNGYNASIAEVTELWSTYMRNVTWNLKNQNELHPPV